MPVRVWAAKRGARVAHSPGVNSSDELPQRLPPRLGVEHGVRQIRARGLAAASQINSPSVDPHGALDATRAAAGEFC